MVYIVKNGTEKREIQRIEKRTASKVNWKKEGEHSQMGKRCCLSRFPVLFPGIGQGQTYVPVAAVANKKLPGIFSDAGQFDSLGSCLTFF